MHHTFLGPGQFEGQVLLVEAVEVFAHLAKHVALVFLAVLGHVAHDVELNVEQFLKLQAHLGALHIVERLWIMDLPQGVVA